MADALDRLFSSNTSEQPNYSLEEQMAYDESQEDLFRDMSDEAKNAFFGGGAKEITFDEPEDTSISNDLAEHITSQDDTTFSENVTEVNESEIQPTYNPEPMPEPVARTVQPTISEPITTESEQTEKPKRKYNRRNKDEDTNMNQSTTNMDNNFSDMFIPVMNQLAKDLIDNLKQNKYKIARFDDKQMQILLNYMYTKF